MNIDSNPNLWQSHQHWLRPLGAVLGVQHDPPSWSYVLATLGLALLIWRWLDARQRRIGRRRR
jgi:hypothetical protein